jgi:hypothetical protein
VHLDDDRSCATRSGTSTVVDIDGASIDIDTTIHDCADDLADSAGVTVVDDDPVRDDAAGVDDGATCHRHVGTVLDDPGDDDPGSDRHQRFGVRPGRSGRHCR